MQKQPASLLMLAGAFSILAEELFLRNSRVRLKEELKIVLVFSRSGGT
jgi:hypothetical protein